MSEPIEGFPVIDFADLALVGWTAGPAADGSFVFEASCPHGCRHHVKLAAGGQLSRPDPGTIIAKDVDFGGPPTLGPAGPPGT